MKRLFAQGVALLLMILSGAAQATLLQGEPDFNSSTDSGLYVWQTVSGEWHIRLVGGGQDLVFDGYLESDGEITDVQPIALQPDDSVLQPATGVLDLDFSVSGAGVDGVRFRAGRQLCLRSAGLGIDSGYFGEAALPATLPVDLTGNGACVHQTPEQKGLVISDAGNDLYNLRLISTDAAEQFSGHIESTADFRWYKGVLLENTDVIQGAGPAAFDVALAAWPGGTDGADIKLAAGAGLCVRATGGEFSQIVLVNAQGYARLVSAPVDVTGSGACDGAVVSPPAPTPPPDPAPAPVRKFNAGHYIALMRGNDSQKTMAQSMKPGVVGFLKRYTWRELEPTRGNYDFSEIRSDLNYLAGQGKQLVVMIEDKTFVNEDPMPAYLSSLSYVNRKGGRTGARWNSQYVNRFNALVARLGQQFDGNPAFEGIANQESAPGLTSATLDASGYTPEKYRDALINMMTNATVVMPTSRVFLYMNFLPRKNAYMSDIAAALKDTGVILGGPDIMPDDYSLQKHTYPVWRQFAGQMPIFAQIEPVCYQHLHKDTSYPTKYWTMSELFNYGVYNLSTEYIFWVRYKKPAGSDWYDYNNAYPVIGNTQYFNQ